MPQPPESKPTARRHANGSLVPQVVERLPPENEECCRCHRGSKPDVPGRRHSNEKVDRRHPGIPSPPTKVHLQWICGTCLFAGCDGLTVSVWHANHYERAIRDAPERTPAAHFAKARGSHFPYGLCVNDQLQLGVDGSRDYPSFVTTSTRPVRQRPRRRRRKWRASGLGVRVIGVSGWCELSSGNPPVGMTAPSSLSGCGTGTPPVGVTPEMLVFARGVAWQSVVNLVRQR